jgi:hypothetical protein
MSIFLNKFLLNVLSCGLILSCPLHTLTAASTDTSTAEQPQTTETSLQWKNYSFPDSGFAIDFPTKPERIQQSIEVPKSNLKINYETFLSEPNDNMVFVVSVWNYPSEIDMSKPEVNLQDGFKGMLSALPGSEVKKMDMTNIDGFKALEFLVKNENIYFQGKLILVYNTLYQVFTVYKNTEEMKNNYDHFIDSFELIHPEKRKAEPAPNKKEKGAPAKPTRSNKMSV